MQQYSSTTSKWTPSSSALNSRHAQTATHNLLGHQINEQVGVPYTTQNGWRYEARHYADHQTRLKDKIHRLSQEVWDTTPGDCMMLDCQDKSENDLSSGVDCIAPRPLCAEPPELAHIGARFDGLGEVPVYGDGHRQPRAERGRKPLTTNPRDGQPRLTRPNRPRLPPGSLPFMEHVETTGSIYTDHLHRQSLRAHGGSGHTPQPMRALADPIEMRDPASPRSSVGTPTSTTPRPQPHTREYPDFFYAENEERYVAYKYECSRYYQDFPEFMRRGLDKHKNHIEQEGISQKDFERAMRVPPPRGKLTERKIRDWYLQTRLNFFGTPLDEPIKECENSGEHELEKGKRSRDKNRANFETPTKRPRTAEASPATGSSVTADHAQSTAVSGMVDTAAANQYLQLTDQSGYRQPLADLGESNDPPYTPVFQSFGSVSINNMSVLNRVDFQNLHVSLAQDIQKIYTNLSMIHQGLLADSTSNQFELQTKRFQLVVHHIGQCVDNYLGSAYSFPAVTPGESSQHPGLFDWLSQHTTGGLPVYPQLAPVGTHTSPKNPMLTPGASSGYNAMDTGQVNQPQDYFSFQ